MSNELQISNGSSLELCCFGTPYNTLYLVKNAGEGLNEVDFQKF